MKQRAISFQEAMTINLFKAVAYCHQYRNGDSDEVWFPRRCLWDKKIYKLPIQNYSLGDLFNGKWIVDEKE
ncbi:hypothetical protein [Virgibacillus pantothenticus]|uniref:hypothetical protein n=1 Tax=Virgibacillus pantothenticus TaxID=1473 RepID=UPI0009851E49|nr:hypothetical protein [Virgibacillus pantothenticus]